jgi:hypothetical protein
MDCVHPLVEKDDELVFFYLFIYFNVDEYSYVKSYSSTSFVFVSMFNFGLLV